MMLTTKQRLNQVRHAQENPVFHRLDPHPGSSKSDSKHFSHRRARQSLKPTKNSPRTLVYGQPQPGGTLSHTGRATYQNVGYLNPPPTSHHHYHPSTDNYGFMNERRPAQPAAPGFDHNYQEQMSSQPLPEPFFPQHIGWPMAAPCERPYTAYSPHPQLFPSYPPTNSLLFYPITDQSQPISLTANVQNISQTSNQIPPATEPIQHQDICDPHFCPECGTKLLRPSDSVHPLRFEEWHSPEACAKQRLLNDTFVTRRQNPEQMAMATQRARESALEAAATATGVAAKVPPTSAITQQQGQEIRCEAESPKKSNTGSVGNGAPSTAPLPPSKKEKSRSTGHSGQHSGDIAAADLQDRSILPRLKEGEEFSSSHPTQAQTVRISPSPTPQYMTSQSSTSSEGKEWTHTPAHSNNGDDESNNRATPEGKRPATPIEKDYQDGGCVNLLDSTPSPSSPPSPTLSAAKAADYDVIREIYMKPAKRKAEIM